MHEGCGFGLCTLNWDIVGISYRGIKFSYLVEITAANCVGDFPWIRLATLSRPVRLYVYLNDCLEFGCE